MSWLIQEADVRHVQFTVEDIAVLVLNINLAAVHVSIIGTWLSNFELISLWQSTSNVRPVEAACFLSI